MPLWAKHIGAFETAAIPTFADGIATNGISRTTATKTRNYTLLRTDDLVVFNGAPLTATLPDPTTTGIAWKQYTIKNSHSTALTVASAGTSTTVDRSASQSLPQSAKATFVSDGTQWLTA